MPTFVTNRQAISFGLNGSPMMWGLLHNELEMECKTRQLSLDYSDWCFISEITESFILSLIDYGFPDLFVEKIMQEIGTKFCYSAFANLECVPFVRENYLK